MDASSEKSSATSHFLIEKRAISNGAMLNEAYTELTPKSYSRGMRIDLNGLTILLISGTFSSDKHGNTVYIGDFRAQLRRTLDNITGLLAVEGCTWHDVVRTTCYLRDMDRDYDAFNEVRTAFFNDLHLDPLPASTGVEAKLCRPDLLVDIDAIAMFQTKVSTGDGNA